MTTLPAAVVAMAVLASAGALPTVALVGFRWVTVPLAPLVGAVGAAVAATCFVATGGTFAGWFVAWSVLGAVVVGSVWMIRPERRPAVPTLMGKVQWLSRQRLAGIAGAIAVTGTCVWCLRGLSTPTVGFDARALWLMRTGWFLGSHHQMLTDLRTPYLVLIQTPYPPLVSAATAVAATVTGNHSMRLGVVVVALLNTCALMTAAFALVDCGRRLSSTFLAGTVDRGGRHGRQRRRTVAPPLAPIVVGIVAAVLLVFIAFGITEPFMTNGYADPIWSLAAVGAVTYGLQLRSGGSDAAVAAILVVVAGTSKNEGLLTGATIIVLIAVRALFTLASDERRRNWWRPVVVAGVELALIGAWPALMRAIHARGESSSLSPRSTWWGRGQATYHGMTPYLHVLWVAVPVSVVGGLFLSRARRKGRLANDWWAWAGLAAGVVVVGGAFVTGTGDITTWLEGTVHRVTEFPALTGWWIVAVWSVVATAAVQEIRQSPAPGGPPPEPPPVLAVDDAAVRGR